MIQSLQELLGSSFVITDEERLVPFSKDETHGLAPVMPCGVVKPENASQVSEILKLCVKHQTFLTPRGAGTGKSGGCVPVNGGWVMDFSRMNRILEIDAENLKAVVEPGVVLADLQAAVDGKNLFYPPDPASLTGCTLGGNVAENAGGPSALKYGVTKDYVLGLEVVLPTGEIVRMGKNTVKGVTGYDLTALMCGSEGTLGIVTQITLKLLPKPKTCQTALLIFETAVGAAKSVSAILAAGILPRSLEYVDQISLAAGRHHEVWKQFPSNAKAALIVEVDGDEEESVLNVLSKAVLVAESFDLQTSWVAQNQKERQAIWGARRILSESVKRLKKHKISEDIVVPRSRMAELVEKFEQWGKAHGLLTCAFGHAGDGNLHAQILFDDPSEQAKVEELLKTLFLETLALGGTLTGEHGIGVAKKPYLAMEQSRDLIALQWRIKKAFDPLGILNPGKFLP